MCVCTYEVVQPIIVYSTMISKHRRHVEEMKLSTQYFRVKRKTHRGVHSIIVETIQLYGNDTVLLVIVKYNYKPLIPFMAHLAALLDG